jgi:hypothetical protein
MNEHKHTPGPWFMHDFAHPSVSSDPGPQDVTVSCSTPDTITVASMGNALTATLDEARANAQLIAAAPDMLEALLWLDRKGGLGLDVHDRISAAIRKAEGRHDPA